MSTSIPIPTLHLFPEIDRLLIEFLRNLQPADWEKRTIAPLWSIKDIAAHLLDTSFRTLSILRDGHFGDNPGLIKSYGDLVAYLNRLNGDWVKAFQRVSPGVLIELLEMVAPQCQAYFASLDPFAPAVFSVAWAGEETSSNWFNIAREYTEKWHHQQQMRLAMGQEQVLYSQELYFPFLDTSMQALPYHYRKVGAAEGTVLAFTVDGIAKAKWYLERKRAVWVLTENPVQWPLATVNIDPAIAWRIFTKGISKKEAMAKTALSGDAELGEIVLDMLAVMA